MKVVMPVPSHSDGIVAGGIEKFSQQLVDIVDVTPIYISKEDKKNRRSNYIIKRSVLNVVPDIILINEPWAYNHVKKFNVPIVCIMHEPLTRDVRMVQLGHILREMIDAGVHLYFVSKRQFQFHKEMAKRIQNVDIFDEEIKGFVPSSFCKDMVFSDKTEYDCCTIGRSDMSKNPFRLHRFMRDSDMNSLVMTNDVIYKSDNQNKYVESNRHWKEPQFTLRNLSYNKVLDNLSKSKSFCSTCPEESWGITAMESLGCGVPVILLTDDTGNHASEDIAADSSHYRKLNVKSESSDFIKLVKELGEFSLSKRKEIFEMTNEKHNVSNWKKQFEDIFSKRIKDKTMNKSSRNTLEVCMGGI